MASLELIQPEALLGSNVICRKEEPVGEYCAWSKQKWRTTGGLGETRGTTTP